MSELSPQELRLKTIAQDPRLSGSIESEKNHDFMLDVVNNMDKYGGSFVQSLAACYYTADPFNKRRLLAAFFEYFIKYVPEKWPNANGEQKPAAAGME